MTCSPALLVDENKNTVAVAVVAQFSNDLAISRRVPLAPILAAVPAPEPAAAALERLSQRRLVHPGEHEDVFGLAILHNRWNKAIFAVRYGRQLSLDRL